MIRHYLIDGNNLIGKIPEFWELQKTGKQTSREKLAYLLDRYFHQKKLKVTLHFDGFQADVIKTNKIRIEYSENSTADEMIKREINLAKNPKLVAVVTSDNNLAEFAKVNSCTIIKSEKFAKDLRKKNSRQNEEEIIKSMDNDEFKKLFGVE